RLDGDDPDYSLAVWTPAGLAWRRHAIGPSLDDRTAMTPYRSPPRGKLSDEGDEGNAQGHDGLHVRARAYVHATRSRGRTGSEQRRDRHPVVKERCLGAPRDDPGEDRRPGAAEERASAARLSSGRDRSPRCSSA